MLDLEYDACFYNRRQHSFFTTPTCLDVPTKIKKKHSSARQEMTQYMSKHESTTHEHDLHYSKSKHSNPLNNLCLTLLSLGNMLRFIYATLSSLK